MNLGGQEVKLLRPWEQKGADIAQTGNDAEICLKVGVEFLL